MRKIFLFILLIVSVFVNAQTKTLLPPVGGSNTIYRLGGGVFADSLDMIRAVNGVPAINMANYMAVKRAGAIQLDSTNNVWYGWNPLLNTWTPIGSGGGSGLVTASNGLTAVAGDVQLGGTLDHATSIETVGNTLTVQSSAAAIPFQTNSSGNIALSATTLGGAYTAGFFNIPTVNNTVVPIISLFNEGTGTGANGIGASIDFTLATTLGGTQSNQLISKFTDATFATRTSEFSITGLNNSTSSTLFTLAGTGQTTLNKYGVGSFTTGTPAYTLAVTAAGNVIETSVGTASVIVDSTVLTFNGLSAETTFALTRPNSGFKNIEIQAEDERAAGFKQSFNADTAMLEYQVGITGQYKYYIIYTY